MLRVPQADNSERNYEQQPGIAHFTLLLTRQFGGVIELDSLSPLHTPSLSLSQTNWQLASCLRPLASSLLVLPPPPLPSAFPSPSSCCFLLIYLCFLLPSCALSLSQSLCLLLVYCVISFELSFYIFLSLIIFIYAAAARFLMLLLLLLLLLGGAWRRGAVRCVPNCCKKRQRQRERSMR